MTRFMGPSRRSTKARVEDRAEPAVAPDGAGRGGFPGNLVLRPARCSGILLGSFSLRSEVVENYWSGFFRWILDFLELDLCPSASERRLTSV